MTLIRIKHRNPSRRLILVAMATAVSFGIAKGETNDRPARIRGAAALAGPAVVSIRPMGIVAGPIVPPFVPPFRRFGRPPLPIPEAAIAEQRPAGSGLIVDAERGLVLTSASLLRGTARVEILFADGATRESRRVVFGDPWDDLALIEFDRQGAELAQVEWGDSTAIRLGDDILAVGRSARGELLASVGIVAAERRRDEAGSELAPFATDAFIARETGGGPLLNLDGQVVGISQFESESLLRAGPPRADFGLATPAALARAVVDELAAGGGARRGFLGVMLGTTVREPGELIGEAEGVVVTAVIPGSPGAEAGIEPGDRILSIDGRAVRDALSFSRVVAHAPVGGELTLRIERRGMEIELKARTRAEGPQSSSPSPRPPVTSEPNLDPRDEEDGESSEVQEQPAEPSDPPPAISEEP